MYSNRKIVQCYGKKFNSKDRVDVKKMNDTEYIPEKEKWLATKLIESDGLLQTQYRGLWNTEQEALKALAPILWNGQRA